MKLINRILGINNQAEIDDITRQKYGMFVSVFSVFSNVFLFGSKFFVGIISNSISIRSDAFNNLSDAVSNVSSLVGFKIAGKRADKDHPYGHGRGEYISGMVISFFILLVGFQSLKDSIVKVIHPVELSFSYISVFILLFSIIVKLVMAYYNNKIGKVIDSPTLFAASKDSLNDVVTTGATLISLFFSLLSDFSIDGYIGILVSIFVLKSGVEVFQETSSPLLGQIPEPEFVKEVVAYVTSFDEILGVHDLMIHDYGVSSKFITLHAEVSSDSELIEIHDVIDEIERKMLEKFNAPTTIHYDPIDINDDFTNELRLKVENIVTSIDSLYSIHDFRVVKGITHTNVIFDVVIPIDDHRNEIELKKLIKARVKELNETYYSVIQIDHTYISLE